MKITCPKCNTIGNLPDHEIHETDGRFIVCPSCNHGFDIKRPKNIENAWLVDVCPACNYSTFGEQRFGVCPKCGITVKVFIDTQWKEKAKKRKHKMQTDRVSYSDEIIDPDGESKVAKEISKKFHPAELIGWTCILLASVVIVLNVKVLIKYYSDDFQSTLLDESLTFATTRLYYYIYGVQPWLELFFGFVLLGVTIQFLRYRDVARKFLAVALWIFICYFPLSQCKGILSTYLNPLPNLTNKYLFEFLSVLASSLAVCVPLYFMIRFLGDKRITSAVKFRNGPKNY